MILPRWRNPIWNLSVCLPTGDSSFRIFNPLPSLPLNYSGQNSWALYSPQMSFSPLSPYQRHFFLVKTLPIKYDQICRFVTTPLSHKRKISWALPKCSSSDCLFQVHHSTFTADADMQKDVAVESLWRLHLLVKPFCSCSHLTLHGPSRVIIALVTGPCLFFDLPCPASYDLARFFCANSRPKVFMLRPHFLTERYFLLKVVQF